MMTKYLELEVFNKTLKGQLEIANQKIKKLELEVEESTFDVKSAEEAYQKIKELLKRT